MSAGEKIRTRRKALGMTKEQLAEAVHVSPQAVDQWESGKDQPDIYDLGSISRALHMDRQDLSDSRESTYSSWVVRDQFFSVENMRTKLLQIAEHENLVYMQQAVHYAEEAHRNQFRKTSVFSKEDVPYIVHPFIMTCQAHALGIHDDVVLATALLHDVCEDTNVKPEELPFPESIQAAVCLLSKTEGAVGDELDLYYSMIRTNQTAAIVKVLDRCNNISTMMLAFTDDKIIDYIDETQKYVIPLIEHIKKNYFQYYDAVFVLKYQMVSVIESAKATMMRMKQEIPSSIL